MFLGLLAAACSGASEGSSESDGASVDVADNPFGEVDPGALEDGVPFSTRVARLTHTQYDNTVSDLLGIATTASSEFESDPVFNGYDNSIEDLNVAGRLGRDYRRAAEELSVTLVQDGAAYAALLSCAAADATCAADFVRSFGLRAYRRPLTSAEQTRYEGLFAQGASLVGSGDALRDGVQVVVEAMLQSPKFLYRHELTQTQSTDGFLQLSGYEVATRLSYLLWNTMPDQALFDAAGSSALNDAEGLVAQTARMLDDPRATRPVSSFHAQWLQFGNYLDLSRSPSSFPNFSSDLGPAMQQETTAFIQHVVFELNKGFETLMTAPFTFANQRLAALYGVQGPASDALERVDLDPTERGGLLTQLGFLASQAYPNETSPIHRGVFVFRRVLCGQVPEPIGIDTSQGRVENPTTTREAIEIQTGQPGCTTCHSLFNHLGFAFEGFDAVGQARALDRGNPVNTSGSTSIDGTPVSFQAPLELVRAIAASDQARRCYADNWLRFAYGRDTAPSDAAALEQITLAMRSDDYTVQDMLSDLVASKAFRFRAPNAD